MSKTIGQFDYRIIKMEKDSNLPFNPIIQITLQHWTTGNADDTPTISPHLMTEGEIDYHIEALKRDLDAVGRRAKSVLRRANEETRAIVGARVS